MSIYVLLLLIAGGVIVYIVATYNQLAAMKTQMEASTQEIGNQLKRQADLLPNLEASVKGYLKHEKDIYKDLTDARKAIEAAVKSGANKAISQAEEMVAAVLPKIQVLVESNPEIKGNEVVMRLMNELRDTSDKVMYARRTLIDLTQDFNQTLVVFPSNLVANVFGFKKAKGVSTPTAGEFLEVSESETKTPKVNI